MTEIGGETDAPSLDGLTLSSEASDHAVNGFHHRHTAEVERMPAIGRAFFDLGYGLQMITCEDRREDNGKMRLVYSFDRFGPPDRHVIFAEIAPDDLAPSLTSVYEGANWFEREVYDMYGVRFSGHPDLKRLLLPDGSDFFPLLKDFGLIADAPEAPKKDAPTRRHSES